jgi:hypothetical protein
MKTLNEVKKILSTNKQLLFDKFNLKSLSIFGSYARNEQTQDSDIDILVDFRKPIGIEFIDLADELEDMLNHRVDLVSQGGIKPKYFDYIKEDLQYV